MDTETELQDDQVKERDALHTRKRSPVKSWAGVLVVMAVIGGGWWFYQHRESKALAANAKPAAPPQVTVSKPLVENLDTRLGFLGQFSAVDQVELRAQVGGTLTGIYFKDGDIVHKGDLLFSIDPVPYEIRLAQAKAQLENATAKRVLAEQELRRAQELERNDAGTVENVQQRTSDLSASQAAIDDAQAQIRDARFDLDHCRIAAPFTGRIGRHLVSIGNLIAGSRAATSPTTLLATIVSLDPIYLDFDMSEADFQTFSHYRGDLKSPLANKVELTSGNGNDTVLKRQGTLDFVDNVLDRSSGTIHARATVANPDLRLTPGEFARVRLAVARPVPTLLIPDASVLPDQSEHIVLTVAADGTVVPKQVQVGDMRGGLRVIRSGLNADDRVIVDGLPFAAPGARVATRDGTLRYAATQGQ
ncbi:efflux RND transporter periplasmic adaptor subunit [Paraburkholderia sp. SOS3]|uniref:efflux RND transporter periplasmic adaptor subunit n=1 Tax=Paraburkholderia sp. SOS3 TaxID=1926494 RepID=UPI000947770C|nr:efflux RND transporter periplasmic adaptor subunit [Paraburkholderia sp. SOS3]APR38800.1 efflux transporter periplasmic adaptor subunit [Paraburkholderia sp. SOS3]